MSVHCLIFYLFCHRRFRYCPHILRQAHLDTPVFPCGLFKQLECGIIRFRYLLCSECAGVDFAVYHSHSLCREVAADIALGDIVAEAEIIECAVCTDLEGAVYGNRSIQLAVYIDIAFSVGNAVYADNMNKLCRSGGCICARILARAAACEEIRLACLILGKTPAACLRAADDALNRALCGHYIECFNGKAVFSP